MKYTAYLFTLVIFLWQGVLNAQVSYEPYDLTNTKAADKKLVKKHLKIFTDSLGYKGENGTKNEFSAGRVVYAPDGKFKVLVIDEEYCGAYCNMEYHSFFLYKDRGKEVMLPAEVAAVDHIISLPGGAEYLIFCRYGIRPRSMVVIEMEAVYHIKLTPAGIEKIPFEMYDSWYPAWEASVLYPGDAGMVPETRIEKSPVVVVERAVHCTSRYEDQGMALTYLPDSQVIDYTAYELVETDSFFCMRNTGRFTYKNGRFVQSGRKVSPCIKGK